MSRISTVARLEPPPPPPWCATPPDADAEALAFAAGSALAALHPIARDRTTAPHELLRDRLALAAAEASLRLEGRPETVSALRDGVHLLRPGERPGPSGAVFQLWRTALRGPAETAVKGGTVSGPEEGATARSMGPPPLAKAATALETALKAAPRDVSGALVAAEMALAAALGWTHPLALIALGLARRDLRARGSSMREACARAVASSASRVASLAADLARGAERLESVAPRLRSKGAAVALRRFLVEDAISPSIALADSKGRCGTLSDRAARRLCDRLVSLGAIRELTGRANYRLYGL